MTTRKGKLQPNTYHSIDHAHHIRSIIEAGVHKIVDKYEKSTHNKETLKTIEDDIISFLESLNIPILGELECNLRTGNDKLILDVTFKI